MAVQGDPRPVVEAINGLRQNGGFHTVRDIRLMVLNMLVKLAVSEHVCGEMHTQASRAQQQQQQLRQQGSLCS